LKQLLKLVLLAALCAALLCGCGSKDSQSSGTTSAANTSAESSDSSAETANLTAFSAETLDGETFSQADFSDYSLTMVNLWTTWCGYCIQEMPALQEVYESLPDGVNMISICCDADEEAELAKQILSENGCAFQTLIINDTLELSLLQYIQGFPTTVFVDSSGTIVGQMQVGAPSAQENKIADAYLSLIEDRLNQLPVASETGI